MYDVEIFRRNPYIKYKHKEVSHFVYDDKFIKIVKGTKTIFYSLDEISEIFIEEVIKNDNTKI